MGSFFSSFLERRLTKGFTLIEVAIVITVISLLIGGVTGGKKLIDKAKIDRITADIKQFTKAAEDFTQTYGALPGDIADPTGTAAVTILPSATPAAVAGNGDGKVNDTSNGTDDDEALHFWRHLAIANLLPGNFSGLPADINVVALSGKSGAVPAGPLTASGYKVATDPSLGLYVDFTKYSAAASTLAILTPEDAWYIDKKMDDGNPSTGIVRAVAGSDVVAANCFAGSAYTLTTTTPTCTLRFYVQMKRPYATPGSTATCNGSAVGSTRVSSTTTCPAGYIGNIIQVCKDNGNGTGTWTDSRKLCKLASCGSGTVVGDTRTLQCPENYRGSITLTCNASGTWTYSDTCTVITGGTCTTGTTRNLACPIGYTGSRQQVCSNNTWQAATGSCTAITCTLPAANLGVSQASATTCALNGAVYTTDASATYAVTETCTFPLTATNGTRRVTSANCLPDYAACAGSTIRDIKCPPGQSGMHRQQCNGSTYQTVYNTCQPVTCGGEPIGSIRPAIGRNCPAGYIGTVLEVCEYTDANLNAGKWTVSTANCGQMSCPAITGSTSADGYASWPLTTADTASVNDSGCMNASYRDFYGTTRGCGIDGNWLPVSGGCTLSPAPYAWLDATDPNGNGNAVNDGVLLTPWVDKGSGYSITGSGGATNPVYRKGPTSTTPFLDNKPALYFDGTDDFYTVDKIVSTGTNFTIFIVAARADNAAGNWIINHYQTGNTANTDWAIGYKSDTSAAMAQCGGSGLSVMPTGYSTTIPVLFYGQLSASGHVFTIRSSVNPYLTITDALTVTLGAYTTAYIGRTGAGHCDGAGYFNGYIAEIMTFNSALSAAQVASIQKYLNLKWGIY